MQLNLKYRKNGAGEKILLSGYKRGIFCPMAVFLKSGISPGLVLEEVSILAVLPGLLHSCFHSK